jgi:hypothetical protein
MPGVRNQTSTQHRDCYAVVCDRLEWFVRCVYLIRMAVKKNGSATPWEYHPALLPIRFRDESVSAGTGYGGGMTTTPETGRLVLMQYADKAEQKRFLEALLELPWLATEIRRPIGKALGRPVRKQNDAFGHGRSMAYRHLVSEVEARMRAHDERPPRGGFQVAAIEEVAETVGMTAEALGRRIRRLKC